MMHFQHHVEIAHAIPGRVRLRVPKRRGHASFFAEAKRRIATLDGVSSVSVSLPPNQQRGFARETVKLRPRARR